MSSASCRSSSRTISPAVSSGRAGLFTVMVVDLIRQINVFEGGKVEVVFRHGDEADKVMRMLENLPEDAIRQQAV